MKALSQQTTKHKGRPPRTDEYVAVTFRLNKLVARKIRRMARRLDVPQHEIVEARFS